MLQERNRQRSDAGPHLEHEIILVYLGKRDYLLKDRIVDEEVLPERLFGGKPVRFEHRTGGGRRCER